MDSVSIIVPLYKGQKYVERIIEMISENARIAFSAHVADQIELIFVNDYPGEDIILPEYDISLISIKLLQNAENTGIHGSRVKGLAVSSGKYVLFLDQDDTIKNTCIHSQFHALHCKKNAKMVIANGSIDYNTANKVIYPNRIMHSLAKHEYAYAFLDNRIISPGQCLIYREIIPEVWINNPLSLNGADDLFLWIVILSETDKKGIVLNREILYTHISTGENISQDLNGMYASVGEMTDILARTGKADEQLLKIFEYKNAYLSGQKYDKKIGLLPKLLISVIYGIKRILAAVRRKRELA